MITSDTLNDLAAQVITILASAAPYLKKAAGDAAAKLGAEAWKRAQDLYQQLRDRFEKDGDQEAEQTLTLFLKNPDNFESALSTYLLAALEQHPQWAEDIRNLLAGEPSLQEIILRNKSRLERVTLSLSGSGTQRIEADDSTGRDIRIEKK